MNVSRVTMSINPPCDTSSETNSYIVNNPRCINSRIYPLTSFSISTSRNRKWSNAIPLCAPVSNYTNSGDSIAMLNGDIDAMLSDRPFEPADILKLRDTPAILSPESYKAAMTRVAATKLLRRSPIETYKSRVTRVNRLLRRDTER